ncbi:MAG TPA: lipocalin family protein [Chryseolinea sp.]|nr:lipocalin family protein [Chryseolinea sp.]
MRNRIIYSLAFVSALFTIAACNDDDEKPASLLGSWQGDKVEASVRVDGFPEPFVDNDENFAGQAEFKSNGTVIFKDDGDITEGTWAQNGNTLILSVDGLSEEDDISGSYTIKELNSSRLKIYIEKEAMFYDDESGIEFIGELKATLYFNRK